MDSVRHRQELFARMGYLTAAIDSRYHGRRAALPPELAEHVSAAAQRASTTVTAAAALQPPPPAAAAAAVHALKGLDARLVSALEKADAAAGYSSTTSSTPTMAAPLANTHGNTTAAAETAPPPRAQRLHLDPHPLPPAPPEAWLGAIAELKKHHGAATAAAVLATLPPAPPPGAAGSAPYSRSSCTAPGAPGDKDTVRK